jgi:hypothetical protein
VSDASPLYDRFAAAFVRGRAARGDLGVLPRHLAEPPRADLERLFAAAGVRRVRFEGVLNHTVVVANTAGAERVPA